MTTGNPKTIDELSKEQLVALVKHYENAFDHFLGLNNEMIAAFRGPDGKPREVPREINQALNKWSHQINDAMAISNAEINRIAKGAPRGENADRSKMN